MIERYLGHYRSLLGGQNYDECESFEFDNLVKVMLTGLPATDWVPPLLRYFDKFRHERLMEFLTRLDNKFSTDWIGQYAPTERIDAMNRVIKVIDDAKSAKDVFDSGCFDIDIGSFVRVVSGDVYGKRFAKYILLKLDFIYQNHDQRMHFETLSVEHILPQSPHGDSQWAKDFAIEDQTEWTNKIGNLVLITRRKNSSQGRLDYVDKKAKYFEKCIDTCPNSLRVLNTCDSSGTNRVEEQSSSRPGQDMGALWHREEGCRGSYGLDHFVSSAERLHAERRGRNPPTIRLSFPYTRGNCLAGLFEHLGGGV